MSVPIRHDQRGDAVERRAALSAAVIVSAPLSGRRRAQVRAGALAAWPFLRPFELDGARASLALRAPDTDGAGYDDVILERAFTQNEAVYDALPGWSAGYPEVAFALVEVEVVAGHGRYGGYVCRGGEVETVVVASQAGDRTLLREVGIDLGEPLASLLGASRSRAAG